MEKIVDKSKRNFHFVQCFGLCKDGHFGKTATKKEIYELFMLSNRRYISSANYHHVLLYIVQ